MSMSWDGCTVRVYFESTVFVLFTILIPGTFKSQDFMHSISVHVRYDLILGVMSPMKFICLFTMGSASSDFWVRGSSASTHTPDM